MSRRKRRDDFLNSQIGQTALDLYRLGLQMLRDGVPEERPVGRCRLRPQQSVEVTALE